jgi:hypothetical protein
MKLIVIVVVVVVLLAGGGGAAYFFHDALFGAAGEQAAAKLPIEKTPDALFVDLETLNIAVIHKRRIEKHVVLQVALEVVNEAARVRVSKSLPRIKDAFIKDMYDFYAYQNPDAGAARCLMRGQMPFHSAIRSCQPIRVLAWSRRFRRPERL